MKTIIIKIIVIAVIIIVIKIKILEQIKIRRTEPK